MHRFGLSGRPYNVRQGKSSPQKTVITTVRFTNQDRKALEEIKSAGFGSNTTEAIRFALQRAVRWVRDQEAA